MNAETNAAWLTVRLFPRWPAHPFRANRQVSGSKSVGVQGGQVCLGLIEPWFFILILINR